MRVVLLSVLTIILLFTSLEPIMSDFGPASPTPSQASVIYENGNVKFVQNVSLSADVYANNVTIFPGVWIFTNGFSFITDGFFNNEGTIFTGYSIQQNFPDSYGGSGGGGHGTDSSSRNGFSTIASGGLESSSNLYNGTNGSSFPLQNLNAGTIQNWYKLGFQNYLAGAAGGSVQAFSGGGGANGIYIQAEFLSPGTIIANGHLGTSDYSFAGVDFGFSTESGGGGGGVIVLAHGPVGYSPGKYSVNGSYGGYNFGFSISSDIYGGTGGNGQVYVMNYSSKPPIPVDRIQNPSIYSPPISMLSDESISFKIVETYNNSVLPEQGTIYASISHFNVTSSEALISSGVKFTYHGSSSGAGGGGGIYFNLLETPDLPFLTANDMHLLSEGLVPFGANIVSGSVTEGALIVTGSGLESAYEISSPAGKWFFSEYSGALIGADLNFSGYHMLFVLKSATLPMPPVSPSLVALLVTIVISTIVILAPAAWMWSKRVANVKSSSNGKGGDTIDEKLKNALISTGLATEEDLQDT